MSLKITNLVKTYSNGVKALKGIDLTVQEGDFFALLGPNGAGKSTTIGIISSLINKTSGKVEIFGIDMDKDINAAKSLLGIVPQEFNFSIFETVYNIVLNQAGFYGLSKSEAKHNVEKYLKQLGLWDKRNNISRTLSGGMKRRLMIARALVHNPKMLILDEPTAGVDIELRRSTWKFLQDINNQGTTIILTTHYLEEAESLCKGIAIINEGKIVKNTSVKELLKSINYESLIIDIDGYLSEAPKIKDCEVVLIDENTIEVTIEKDKGLNCIFTELTNNGYKVVSLRNKSNRLEELFLNLVTNGN